MKNLITLIKGRLAKYKEVKAQKFASTYFEESSKAIKSEVLSWVSPEYENGTESQKVLYEFAVLQKLYDEKSTAIDSYPRGSLQHKQTDKELAEIMAKMYKISNRYEAILEIEEGIIDDTINKALNGND